MRAGPRGNKALGAPMTSPWCLENNYIGLLELTSSPVDNWLFTIESVGMRSSPWFATVVLLHCPACSPLPAKSANRMDGWQGRGCWLVTGNWDNHPNLERYSQVTHREIWILLRFDVKNPESCSTIHISRDRRPTTTHLRGSALGFRNLTNYIARSLLETGGFRPFLHSRL